MTAVLALLRFIVGQLTLITGLITGLNTGIDQTAKEHSIYNIEDAAGGALATVNDATFGNAALRTQVDALAAQVNTFSTALFVALGTPQQAGSPVTLPAVAPSGYGGSSAHDVWAYTVPGSSTNTGGQLVEAGRLAHYISGDTSAGFISGGAPGWYITGDWQTTGQTEPNVNTVVPVSPMTILSTDATYAAWLARAYPTRTFHFDTDGRAYIDQGGGTSWRWHLEVGPADFKIIQEALFPVGSVQNGLPVFPGSANVTYDGGTALSDGLKIVTPMNGCEVVFSTPPPHGRPYIFGDLTSWQFVGALAFEADDATDEEAQSLGFSAGMYTPRTMRTAAAVRFRVAPGVTGTVHTWLINP